jgi:hypothetical protein
MDIFSCKHKTNEFFARINSDPRFAAVAALPDYARDGV